MTIAQNGKKIIMQSKKKWGLWGKKAPELHRASAKSNFSDEASIRDLIASQKNAAGKSLLEPDQIQSLTIGGDRLTVVLEITQNQLPIRQSIETHIREALRQNTAFADIQFLITAHKNSSSTPNPYAHKGELAGISKVKKIIAVASGKGGVGKSTTAVNLAVALSTHAQGLRVGILDCDIYGPSVPRMMGIQQKPVITANKKIIPLEKDGIKLMSMGFLVDPDAANIWRGPMVMGAVTQMLGDVEWGELDFLIVDMPPGTGDAQLTLSQRAPLAGAIIVSTPQDIALIDARKAIAMFRKINVPILGIIENMSYFDCPHCHGRSEIFAHGGARREAEKLGVPFLGEIPLDIKIRENCDAGKTVNSYYQSIAGKIISTNNVT